MNLLTLDVAHIVQLWVYTITRARKLKLTLKTLKNDLKKDTNLT
jgi:hypothetical protein